MKKAVDVVYVVASKLGSIGMGMTAYNAIKEVDKRKNISYKIFCRGYDSSLPINKKNIISYGYLETLSLPLRFAEKKLGLKINPFKYINYFYGKGVNRKLPKCKIYHTWMGIAPEAIIKAKKNGAIMILEGANSHPLNIIDIMNEEYRILNKTEFIQDRKKIEKESQVIKLFDYVMCPSDFVYDSFLKYGISKEKLIKMPYGVKVEDFKVQKDKKYDIYTIETRIFP